MSPLAIGTGPPATGAIGVADAARWVEALDLESFWVPDLVVGDGTPALEPALALATAAAVTERVRVGVGVLVVPLRPAPWLATQVATLQQLSGDRLVLGVGTGGFPDAPFWRALGVSRHRRGQAFDETLRMLPRLLSGEPTDVDGTTLTLAPATMPPVTVGGSTRAFERVLDHGAGWFPSLLSPDYLAPAVADLRERAAARGVPMPEVTVGGHVVLGDDAEARAVHDGLVRDLVEVHGMAPDLAARTPMRARTTAELAELLAAYRDAGADRVVTGPDNGDWKEQVERIATAGALVNQE